MSSRSSTGAMLPIQEMDAQYIQLFTSAVNDLPQESQIEMSKFQELHIDLLRNKCECEALIPVLTSDICEVDSAEYKEAVENLTTLLLEGQDLQLKRWALSVRATEVMDGVKRALDTLKKQKNEPPREYKPLTSPLDLNKVKRAISNSGGGGGGGVGIVNRVKRSIKPNNNHSDQLYVIDFPTSDSDVKKKRKVTSSSSSLSLQPLLAATPIPSRPGLLIPSSQPRKPPVAYFNTSSTSSPSPATAISRNGGLVRKTASPSLIGRGDDYVAPSSVLQRSGGVITDIPIAAAPTPPMSNNSNKNEGINVTSRKTPLSSLSGNRGMTYQKPSKPESRKNGGNKALMAPKPNNIHMKASTSSPAVTSKVKREASSLSTGKTRMMMKMAPTGSSSEDDPLAQGVRGSGKKMSRSKVDEDEEEETYCVCKQVSYGEMIACDNNKCIIEWFHFKCVKIVSKPKGKWYCPSCRGERSNVARANHRSSHSKGGGGGSTKKVQGNKK